MIDVTTRKVLIIVAAIVGILYLLIVVFALFPQPSVPQDTEKEQQDEPTRSFDFSPGDEPIIPGAGIETQEYKQAEREYVEQRPILQKLPADNPFFEIEYISETHLVVIATTEDKERDYREATAWFADNDIDTTNILIDYR